MNVVRFIEGGLIDRSVNSSSAWQQVEQKFSPTPVQTIIIASALSMPWGH